MQLKNLVSAVMLAAVVGGAQANVFFGAAGGAIPDNNATGISSTATYTGPITSIVALKIFGLRHTWVGDLTVTLTNPDGVSLSIFTKVLAGLPGDVGDSSNLGTSNGTVGADYTFAQGGSDFWAAANGGASSFDIPSGVTYQTSGNLFTGVIATSYVATNLSSGLNTATSGNWTLKIVDNAAADTGAYTSWQVEAVPEPASMAALALGVAAFARKRRK
jgi:subtilisin-like proprotein convertase family protein